MNAKLPISRDQMLQDALAVVRSRWSGTPQVAIILGTGLGELAEEIDAEVTIPYREIPHLPHSTAILLAEQEAINALAVGHILVVAALEFNVEDGSIRQQQHQVCSTLFDPGQFDAQHFPYGNPSSQLVQQARMIPLEQIPHHHVVLAVNRRIRVHRR